jgi:NADPH-dependent 2,4-dienoyl-CoA reductase/sulfur reductase-like enzyme
LLKRSIDARRGAVRFRLLVGLGRRAEPPVRRPVTVGGARRVIVVGAGPAGLFAAYELACRGIFTTSSIAASPCSRAATI